MKTLKYILIILLQLPCILHAQEFFYHMSGGEMRYTYVSTGAIANKYKITFKYYRACDARVQFDDLNKTIHFSVFENLGNNSFRINEGTKLVQVNRIAVNKIWFTPTNSCINTPPPFCNIENGKYVAYEVATYEGVVDLGVNFGGYRIAFERCCRKEGITNIDNYFENRTGSTYYVDIPSVNAPALAAKSNSPVFPLDTAIFICANKRFEYPFNAISTNPSYNSKFIYSFIAPLSGFEKTIGLSMSNPNADLATNPVDFKEVLFKTNYNATLPMGANVTIDANTGLISGIAPQKGSYIIGVQATEIAQLDDGTGTGIVEYIVHKHRKDVIINVGDCEKAFAAVILDPLQPSALNPNFNFCRSKNFTFNNGGSPNVDYLWKFGDGEEETSNTNNAVTHTYQNNGSYKLQLIAKPGTQCSDTVESQVLVYDNFNVDFNVDNNCVNATTLFKDQSNSAVDINTRNWTFGLPNAFNLGNETIVDYTYQLPNRYKVGLLVKDDNGCRDSIDKFVDVRKINTTIGQTQYVVPGQPVQLEAGGGVSYSWKPSQYLDNASISTPKAVLTATQEFVVTITTTENCTVEQKQKVVVFDKAAQFMPNSFTPNGDGLNDYVRPIIPGVKTLKSFKIFNRFGNVVYQSNNINQQGWNGTFNQRNAENGVYAWHLEIIDDGNKLITTTGTITLIR